MGGKDTVTAADEAEFEAAWKASLQVPAGGCKWSAFGKGEVEKLRESKRKKTEVVRPETEKIQVAQVNENKTSASMEVEGEEGLGEEEGEQADQQPTLLTGSNSEWHPCFHEGSRLTAVPASCSGDYADGLGVVSSSVP